MRFSVMSSFVSHRYEVDVRPERTDGFVFCVMRASDFVSRGSENDPACVSRIEILVILKKRRSIKREVLDADIRDPMDIL